jgi:nucleotide-binding universal stress UspA family protein
LTNKIVMKVLLTIDPSHTSHVVDAAITRPWPEGTVFCVISVVDMRHWDGLPALIEDARKQAEFIVKAASDKLTQSGHRAFSEVKSGSPKKEISEYAKEWSADLIMVGPHRFDLDRFLLGSVAQAVLRTAPCSIEVVRASAQLSKVLLATDGSGFSARAVDFVACRPWPAQMQIRILSVVQLPAPDLPSGVYPFTPPMPELVVQVVKATRERAEKAVADARETLETAGLKVCSGEATLEGDPRATILEDAKSWGAGLIVLGSHGRHGLERILLGSVAEAVAAHAHCSVQVVR